MRTLRALFLPLLLLTACPDPAGTSSVELPEGAKAAGESPAGDPAAKGADAPGSTPSSIAAPPVGFAVKEGEGVTISGTLSYTGAKTGRVRIDFLRMSDKQPPQLAHTVELPKLGEWTVTAPASFGDLRVVGFLDQTGDGPSKEDPAFAWPSIVKVETEPVNGVDLVLTDTPELGELTPGGRPPAGFGAADGAPPAGPPPGAPPTTPPDSVHPITASEAGQPIEGTPTPPPDAPAGSTP